MLFKLPWRIEPRGKAAYVTVDSAVVEHAKKEGSIVRNSILRMPKIGLVINGSYETSDPSYVKALMKAGGTLRFDPMDAVNENIFTAAEVKAMGFDVPVPDEQAKEPVKEPEVAPIPEPLPNFYTLDKESLIKWADAHEPPIHLDRRKRKDTLVEELLEALDKEKEE